MTVVVALFLCSVLLACAFRLETFGQYAEGRTWLDSQPCQAQPTLQSCPKVLHLCGYPTCIQLATNLQRTSATVKGHHGPWTTVSDNDNHAAARKQRWDRATPCKGGAPP